MMNRKSEAPTIPPSMRHAVSPAVVADINGNSDPHAFNPRIVRDVRRAPDEALPVVHKSIRFNALDHELYASKGARVGQHGGNRFPPMMKNTQHDGVVDTPNHEHDAPRDVFRSKRASSRYLRQKEIVVLLKARGFSTGLAKALALNTEVFEQRYWVVDNSGSMEVEDGHRIVNMAKKYAIQSVSRWEELQDTIGYHSEMAALLQTPTTFKLLNRPAPGVGKREFSVAKKGANVEDDIRKAKEIMGRAKPLGMTPLTQRVWEIRDSIKATAPQLITEGRRVVVVLATDGLPTDEEGYGGDDALEEFTDALKSLEGLPLWLVIRLCTDEEKVRKFYNTLDSKLDLPLDVLDDFLGEAAEVHRHNNWLNYALPIHRCRELGHHDRLFDVIDERPLTKFELREFCALLFGTEIRQIPDPNVNWKDFLMYIQDELKEETKQWDPVQKKLGPWIYLKSLHRRYGNGVCSIM